MSPQNVQKCIEVKSGVDEVYINGRLPPSSQSLSAQNLMTTSGMVADLVSMMDGRLPVRCVVSDASYELRCPRKPMVLSKSASHKAERCY